MAPNYVNPDAGSVTADTQTYNERSTWINNDTYDLTPKITGGSNPGILGWPLNTQLKKDLE